MFSVILKKLRAENGLTQQGLASKLNISTSTIGMYESGKRMPDTSTLSRIASFFSVSTDYLLGINSNYTDSQRDDFEKFMESLDITFIGASRKDKDAIYKKISQLYWEDKDREDKN